MFWGGREGYETLLNTDVKFEQENIASLMRMAVEYGRSIGFEGDFYIEPKPKEPMTHQYDFDAATAIGFLRQYGLDKDFKLNIEANHATLAGHTFQHELRVSAVNGMLGSIDANQGNLLLGWDTDEFPFDAYSATMCMYEVLKNGGLTGGFNFDAKNRRASNTAEDMFYGYILGMDTFALGLIKAAEIIENGTIDEFIEKKYKNIDPEEQEKRRIEQEEKAKREQQRLAAEKSYVDEISKNPKLKNSCFSQPALSAFLGITEPAIFGGELAFSVNHFFLSFDCWCYRWWIGFTSWSCWYW